MKRVQNSLELRRIKRLIFTILVIIIRNIITVSTRKSIYKFFNKPTKEHLNDDSGMYECKLCEQTDL
jgi:hypothetical protein